MSFLQKNGPPLLVNLFPATFHVTWYQNVTKVFEYAPLVLNKVPVILANYILTGAGEPSIPPVKIG